MKATRRPILTSTLLLALLLGHVQCSSKSEPMDLDPPASPHNSPEPTGATPPVDKGKTSLLDYDPIIQRHSAEWYWDSVKYPPADGSDKGLLVGTYPGDSRLVAPDARPPAGEHVGYSVNIPALEQIQKKHDQHGHTLYQEVFLPVGERYAALKRTTNASPEDIKACATIGRKAAVQMVKHFALAYCFPLALQASTSVTEKEPIDKYIDAHKKDAHTDLTYALKALKNAFDAACAADEPLASLTEEKALYATLYQYTQQYLQPPPSPTAPVPDGDANPAPVEAIGSPLEEGDDYVKVVEKIDQLLKLLAPPPAQTAAPGTGEGGSAHAAGDRKRGTLMQRLFGAVS